MTSVKKGGNNENDTVDSLESVPVYKMIADWDFFCCRIMDWLYFVAIALLVVILCLILTIWSSDCDLILLWYLKYGKSPGNPFSHAKALSPLCSLHT